MYVADTLSRDYLNETGTTSFERDLQIVNMVQFLHMTNVRLSEIRKHSYEYESLQVLMDVILHGWPTKRDDVISLAKPYFDFQDELSVQDGILFRGERAIIPKAICLDMMQRIHSSHLGIGGCLRRAKERFLAWNAIRNNYSIYIKLRNLSDV